MEAVLRESVSICAGKENVKTIVLKVDTLPNDREFMETDTEIDGIIYRVVLVKEK